MRPGLYNNPKTPNHSLYQAKLEHILHSFASAVRRNTSEGTSYYLVRLVFRPYTQLKQTICTLVLSPGLHQLLDWLHRRSGLDHKISGPTSYALTQIGSQLLLIGNLHNRSVLHITTYCSCSHHRRRQAPPFAFTTRLGVVHSQTLAYMVDSLVRVSRRVIERLSNDSWIQCSGKRG